MMLDYVHNTPTFNATAKIQVYLVVKTSDGKTTCKEELYCECTYRDKAAGKIYRKTFSPLQWDDCLKLYESLTRGEIADPESVFTRGETADVEAAFQ